MNNNRLEECATEVLSKLQKKTAPWEVAVSAFHGSKTVHLGPSERLYEIGSVTKVFAGVLLAKAVQDSRVGLEEPVVDCLKLDCSLDPKITLAHLATHTSGLPRIPTNFRKYLKDMTDPYAEYSDQALDEYLKTVGKTRHPGARYAYSNLGFGVLGRAICDRTDSSFSELLSQDILVPLGLKNTFCHSSEADIGRMMHGHNHGGKPVSNWCLTSMAPAGSMVSNSEDLLKFLRAQVDSDHTLAPALRLCREVHFDKKRTKMGLAWHFAQFNGLEAVWHDGGTGGFSSLVGFIPEREAGIVILINRGPSLVGALLGVDRVQLTAKKFFRALFS